MADNTVSESAKTKTAWSERRWIKWMFVKYDFPLSVVLTQEENDFLKTNLKKFEASAGKTNNVDQNIDEQRMQNRVLYKLAKAERIKEQTDVHLSGPGSLTLTVFIAGVAALLGLVIFLAFPENAFVSFSLVLALISYLFMWDKVQIHWNRRNTDFLSLFFICISFCLAICAFVQWLL